MSFGLKKNFGRICKTESFKQLYYTGWRPPTFSELFLMLLNEKEVGWSTFESKGLAYSNTRGIIKRNLKEIL